LKGLRVLRTYHQPLFAKKDAAQACYLEEREKKKEKSGKGPRRYKGKKRSETDIVRKSHCGTGEGEKERWLFSRHVRKRKREERRVTRA